MNKDTKVYPYVISPDMYKEQRVRLGESLLKDFPDAGHAAFLQAGAEVMINSSDIPYEFEQERYFYYLFGTTMQEVCGVVLPDGKGLVFMPRLPEEYTTWMGFLPQPEKVCADIAVDAVYYLDELETVLRAHGIHTVEVNKGVNTDSGLAVLTAQLPENVTGIVANDTWLFKTMNRQRLIKTPLEAGVLKYVCKVSSEAHIHVMQTVKPGHGQNHLASAFIHHVSWFGGCRRVSYPCVVPTGADNAILHNWYADKAIVDGQLALLDMGGNYCGYAADITCSWPVNGKYTEDQKKVYLAVLDAHDSVARSMKPGGSWVDMHYLSLRTICRHLVDMGILTGDVEVMMKKHIMQFFMPHGLGHMLGLEVHDIGGYAEGMPERPTAVDAKGLRTACIMESGMYLTIEPGLYFNPALLEKALANDEIKPFINEARLRDFWDMGGVRIESNVIVTDTGIVNFTVVPRTVEEVERTMAGEPFKKEAEVFNNA